MSDDAGRFGASADEMAEYLQVFLDETEEQLEDLVETMLVLEREPDRVDELNEVFRLVHSIKGSAGMMGFDSIMLLAHQLESRFAGLRSGTETLQPALTSLVLRCVDFLRDCTRRLRAGETLSSAANLLEELAAFVPSPTQQATASGEEATERKAVAIQRNRHGPQFPTRSQTPRPAISTGKHRCC